MSTTDINGNRILAAASDATGFDQGDKFANEQAVRDYFTVDSIQSMLGESPEQDTLTEWADEIIATGYWIGG